MLQFKEVEKIVRGILENKTHAKKVDNRYEVSMYVDYSDKVSDSQLAIISQADNKMETFYDVLCDFVAQTTDFERDEILKVIRHQWNQEEHGSFEEKEEMVDEIIGELCDFNFPYEHYLKTEVYVNVLVDTGDGNYDYTLNNFNSHYASEGEEIDDESSILWLTKQQGYTKEQLTKAVQEQEFANDSKFLKSVYEECLNVTTHMNALAFFVRMTLEDFIELCDKQQTLTLSSGTHCGLYDLWRGAGGPLEISLEKNVEIPYELIRAHIDGARGYGIDSIYGMLRSFWKETVVSMQEFTLIDTEE